MVIPSGQLGAIAMVRGEGALRGTVKFYPVVSGTLVAAEFAGLPEGGPCSLQLHNGDCPDLYSCNGRAFLAVETSGIQAWDLLGQTVSLCYSGTPIGTGQVCEP